MQQFETALLDGDEFRRKWCSARRGRGSRDRDGLDQRPGRVAITWTSSERKIASSTSWVTKTTVLPKSLHSASSHS